MTWAAKSVTRLHARAVARLTGVPSAARSVVFFADQAHVVSALVGLSVVGSAVVAVGPFVLRHLVDDALPTGRVADLVWPVLGLGVLGVFEAGVLSLRMALIARLGALVMVRIRERVNAHLQRLPFGFFPRSQQGEVMTVLSTDAVSTQNAISATVQAVVCRVSDIVVGLVVVFVLDWRLSLAVMLFAPATLLIVQRGRRELRAQSARQRELDAALLEQVADTASVSGALHVRLFDRAEYEQQRFGAASAKVLDASRAQAALTARVRFMVMCGIALTLTTVITLGAWMVSSGTTTLGTVAALGGALLVSFGPLVSAIDLRSELAAAGAAFTRIFALLDLPVVERAQPATISGSTPGAGTSTGTSTGTGAGVELRLDGVWFSYDLAGATPRLSSPDIGPTWTLRGVDLRVAAGTTAAVVGASGAGKTTITYLASGIYRPQRGAVTLDGLDLVDLGDRLHAKVGVVAQDPHLFHDTIAANLRYGRLDASDDELRDALEDACLGPLFATLPDGLDTRVGARGYRLSGGERQRLAIARVLLQSPDVLVLDEATSALDTVSEAVVRRALDRLAVGRTCLVIAHRLTSVIDADRIYVMDQGQVVEQGTHTDLVTGGGAYATLYRNQEPAKAGHDIR